MGKKIKERTQEEIEANWNGTWKEILQREDGSIDIEQLKKELMDFSDMINRMSSLTCQLTRSRLSYPTYPVSTIMAVHEEVQNEEREQQQEDDREDGACSLCGSELDNEGSELDGAGN